MIEPEKTYTLQEASTETGLPYPTIWFRVRTKELPATRFGKAWAVKGQDLITFMATPMRRKNKATAQLAS
jgi:hypothetical protein